MPKFKFKDTGSEGEASHDNKRRKKSTDNKFPSANHSNTHASDVDDAEAAFQEKLFEAMGLDEGQDSTQAMFNDYIPPRWRKSEADHFSTYADHAGSSSAAPLAEDYDGISPDQIAMMDDEEYAEWIRYGMWVRTHQKEHQERLRKKQEQKERAEKRQRLKEESKKLERETEARRRRRREDKRHRAVKKAWEAYDAKWKELHGSQKGSQHATLKMAFEFQSLPWPVFPPPERPCDISKERITDFLLSGHHSVDKPRRQRLREALLAYHPDRYEGRWMVVVAERDRGLVKEGVGNVIRALNALIEEDASLSSTIM